MAGEFFAEGGGSVAITLTPEANGRLEVYLDNEKIFDKKTEGNVTPTLTRVKELRALLLSKLLASGTSID